MKKFSLVLSCVMVLFLTAVPVEAKTRVHVSAGINTPSMAGPGVRVMPPVRHTSAIRYTPPRIRPIQRTVYCNNYPYYMNPCPPPYRPVYPMDPFGRVSVGIGFSI